MYCRLGLGLDRLAYLMSAEHSEESLEESVGEGEGAWLGLALVRLMLLMMIRVGVGQIDVVDESTIH